MQALALLPTNADINQMLDSLLPETDGIAYDIATDAGDQVLDVASRRLDALRDLNVAAREYKVASAAPVSPPEPTGTLSWGKKSAPRLADRANPGANWNIADRAGGMRPSR
jgi:hypothetical protein